MVRNYSRLPMIVVIGLSIFLMGLTSITSGQSWQQMSDNKTFKLNLKPQADTIPIGSYHSWIINVRDGSGQPVPNARIGVAGGMNSHGHGLPSQPIVTKYLQNGNYLIEGMLFNMPGLWSLSFFIQTHTQSDRGSFNVDVSF